MTETFQIDAPTFDPLTGEAVFAYRLGALRFSETLVLPPPDPVRSSYPEFQRLLGLTAIVLGVSYFKLRAPLHLAAPTIGLSEAEHAFIIDVYENGLGEFYARNGLKRFGRLSLDSPAAEPADQQAMHLSNRALLPIGGGKDSLVSVQLLQSAGVAFTPFAVNPKGPIVTSIDAIGTDPVYVRRVLDSEMLRLSRQPDFYNGHVPSTAINSMIAALCAVLYDYGTIVLSNERSASEGNIVFDGREANHQYSKSLDFESRIAGILSDATGGALAYYSLLRPYSEARIAALFARETRFDSVFSSCNRNFRLDGNDGPLWCGECPKCHFVYLIFAPVMAKARLIGIFGNDLLDDPRHEASFRELTGLAGQKPWECVGEILEAAACLHALSGRPEWRDTAIVRALASDLVQHYGVPRLEAAMSALMRDSVEHFVPRALGDRIRSNAA